MSYTETEEYQKEIREQFRSRVKKFDPGEVVAVLKVLGVEVVPTDLKMASSGNANATYLAPDFVVKINERRGRNDYAGYLAVASLADKYAVPRVLAYDNFEKTPYEVLVINRFPGTALVDIILDLDQAMQEKLFSQLMNVVDGLFTLKFTEFGELSDSKLYPSYRAMLQAHLDTHVAAIERQKTWPMEEIAQIVAYVQKHIAVFDDETECTFVHEDLQMGNILHQGDKLTGLVDFDYACRGPRIAALYALLGFLFNPQQFVEGTPYFDRFKGKKFAHFLPILKQRWPKVFSDPQLYRKLNLITIINNLGWVADDWSKEWNEQLIGQFFATEIDKDLKKSYFGQFLETGRYNIDA